MALALVMLGSFDTASCERDTAALRALARRLLGDEHAAEDAVQETWARTLGSEPDGDSRLPWMMRVLRNVVYDRRRRMARRSQREATVARGEAVPSNVQVIERLEILQHLARAVAELDEPYLTCVHLRYFESLGPQEIARRLDVPVETVRTRLKRGLAALRERLDRTEGGRESWVAGLAPFVQSHEGSSAGLAAVGSVSWIGVLLMSFPIKLAIGGVVAVGVTAWFLNTGDAPAVAAVSAPSSEEPLDAVAALPDAVAPVELARPAARVDQPAAVAEAMTASESSELVLQGRVVVVDPEGREHESLDGQIDFMIALDEHTATQRQVAFEAGTFELELPREALFRVGRVTAGDRPAITDSELLRAKPDLEILVRADWQPDSVLRVVDRETGQELSDVDVRRRWNWRAIGAAIHPGDAEEVQIAATGEASPVLLPPLPYGMRTVAYWARAPGYAWQRIDIDHAAGGERTVELDRAGELVVGAAGTLPAGQRFVRAFSPSRAKVSWDALAEMRFEEGEPVRIPDLQPGRYLVRIDRGEYSETFPLGQIEAEVRAGEVTHVSVPITAEEVETTRFHGQLDVPTELEFFSGGAGATALIIAPYPWNSLPGQGRVHVGSDDLAADESVPGRFHWDAGELRSGRYLVTVPSVMHRVLVDVEALSGEPCSIVVPQLANLTVVVVDAATGERLNAEVSWADGDLEGVGENSVAPALPEGDGAHSIHAVVGTINVRAELEGYSALGRDVELTGDAELTLRLERTAGLRVGYWDGDARVPIAMDVGRPRLTHAETGASVLAINGSRVDSLECRLDLQPGVYELRFEQPPSPYGPIAPMTVEVLPTEIVDVRVELTRTE